MRVLALALLAAAASCARPVRSTPPAPPRGAGPEAAAPAPSPDGPGVPDVLGALALSGDTWSASLLEVPPAQARAVAIDFLRQGGFACTAVVAEEVGCGMTEESFAPVAPAASLDDPCLRRLVARWALEQLEATDVPAVADALAAIVALPLPERELADEVVRLLPPGEDGARLRLIAAAVAAQRDDVADALLPGLTPAGAAQALVELGREAALPHLGARPLRGTLAAALERGVSPETARDIIDLLDVTDLEEPAVAEAMRQLATGDDCALAAQAAMRFDEAGDAQYLPRHIPPTSEAAATRALCVASHVSALEALTVLKPLVGGDGLDLIVVDHADWDDDVDDDHDGDGDPRTRTTREHVEPGELDADTLVDWLPTSCSGSTCAASGGGVTLGFTRTARGGLSLDEIAVEREEHDCGC